MSFDLRSNSKALAFALLVGFLVVAFAIYDSNSRLPAEGQITIQRFNDSGRNVYGSRRAPVTVVEFSDYQCPYCARLHPTLKQLVDESGGQVAWEYRHLPLRSHPLAKPAAVIAECLAEEKGNEAFWQYTEQLFSDQSKINSESIITRAYSLGLSDSGLIACQNDTELSDRIAEDALAAATLGGSGTPFSVIIYPDNTYKSVPGAVSYEQFKSLMNDYVK